jgi:hypothetical protein
MSLPSQILKKSNTGTPRAIHAGRRKKKAVLTRGSAPVPTTT